MGIMILPSKDGTGSFWDGRLLHLIGWRLLATLITVLTLGIGLPWALCLLYKYEVQHTVINNRRLDFDGTGWSLFKQWIIMLLLIIVTLGIYIFWAEIRIKRWETAHTFFAGTR